MEADSEISRGVIRIALRARAISKFINGHEAAGGLAPN
jgi:hypothetical protein